MDEEDVCLSKQIALKHAILILLHREILTQSQWTQRATIIHQYSEPAKHIITKLISYDEKDSQHQSKFKYKILLSTIYGNPKTFYNINIGERSLTKPAIIILTLKYMN